jgi:hypothetical protein
MVNQKLLTQYIYQWIEGELTGREVLQRTAAVHPCHQHLHYICPGMAKAAAPQHNTLPTPHWAFVRADPCHFWYSSVIILHTHKE